MAEPEGWQELARKLDWTFSYASEREVFPEETSGRPWLPQEAWADWEESYRTTCREYAATQARKEAAVRAVREAAGRVEDFEKLPPEWLGALKLHGAALPLAEFAATVGNLRAGRFARAAAWRNAALLGALDELRHTQIPLGIMHPLARWDRQFDWAHRFYHTDNWVAIAARHLADELLLCANPIEFAVATNVVFETGFTNLQFVALSALAEASGDALFAEMVRSIQTDEARHAQIGHAVLPKVIAHDRAYAQYLLDKWFWRSWHLFAVVTGFSMDYLTPVSRRTGSFREFMQEWIVEQYLETLAAFGMERPWYWETFLASLETYHHMVYASAYTYRTTVWFDFVLPGPEERAWLREKYPGRWDAFDAVWEQVASRWAESDPGLDFAAHGTAIVSFCDMCQLVLCEGAPGANAARTLVRGDRKYIFCSEPCEWIFRQETGRYAGHRDVVKRVLAGEAPGNLLAMLTRYFGLTEETWGRDVRGGRYPWIRRGPRRPASVEPVTRIGGVPDRTVPLYGFLEGDTIGLLVFADAADRMEDLAAKLERSAQVRVRPRPGGRVRVGGRLLPGRLTVEEAGLSALDRFDVTWGEA